MSRRDALRLGGLGLLGVVAAPGCDVLVVTDRPGPDDALEPITAGEDHYIQSCCGPEDLDPDTWVLSIGVEGSEIATLTYADLLDMETEVVEHTLQCIGGRPRKQMIDNALWTGRRFLDILADLGITVPASAERIAFLCADEYSTSIPVTDLDRPVWLVWELDGAPLDIRHGFPARFLVPGRYGTKNPKWPVAVDFVSEADAGYWESRGWSDDATYQPNAWIAIPADGEPLPNEAITLLGTAYAGSDPIVRVAVSADGGETWEDADLTYAPGADRWTLWRFTWDPPSKGEHTLQARCFTQSGGASVLDPTGSNRLIGYDGSMQITVTVA